MRPLNSSEGDGLHHDGDGNVVLRSRGVTLDTWTKGTGDETSPGSETIEGDLEVGGDLVVTGLLQVDGLRTQVTEIAHADVIALAAVPQIIAPSPGEGKFIEHVSTVVKVVAGTTPWTEAGDNLEVAYTDAAGAAVATIETTDLIDAAADTVSESRPATAPIVLVDDILDRPLVLRNDGAEFGGGDEEDGVLQVVVTYRIREFGTGADVEAQNLRTVHTIIEAVAIKGLKDTPAEIAPAPGPGRFNQFDSAVLKLVAGSEVLAETADNLAVKYTDGSGALASATIECTGFIDANAVDKVTFARPAAAGPIAAAADVEDAALVLHNINDEFTGNASNDAELHVICTYRIVEFPA